MPTLADWSLGPENAALASMMSLPAFANEVASGKTKNGAPLPTRFWTAMSLDVDVGIAVNGVTSAVSFMTLGAIVVQLVATAAQMLADVRLTVPTRTPLIVSCAPTAKPFATHD